MKEQKVKSLKIVDSNAEISAGSRADLYWKTAGVMELFKKLRPGLNVPENFIKNPDNTIKQFKLKAVAFGNWVTIEDRINYTAVMFLSFYDMNKVVRFNSNIGLNNLSVTFGDRGFPKSLAHYNPGSILININRYKRGASSKEFRFLTSGGVHSFAHEYGHFLDYFAGGVLEPTANYYACTGGHSVARYKLLINSPIRAKVDDILFKIMWQKTGKLTEYYSALVALVNDEESGFGEYWIRRNELFARAFEKYIQFELNEMGIKNHFLTKTRYTDFVYVPDNHFKTLVPDFREFIKLTRDKINQKQRKA